MSDASALFTALRADPTDIAAGLVLADHFQQIGDPRGELMALEVEMAADPARVPVLDEVAAEVAGRNWKHLWGKPGGFPFVERWEGRSFVGYSYEGGFRGASTAAKGIARIHAMLRNHTAMRSATRISPGPGSSLVGGRLRRRDWHLEDGTADNLAAIEALATGPSGASRRYSYLFRFRQDGVLLPYQRGGYYAGGNDLISSISYQPDLRSLVVRMAFPFEDFDDDFRSWFAGIESDLGPVFNKTGWYRMVPKVKGDGMKTTRTSGP